MPPLPHLRIGSVDIGSPFVQAALSGYSDWPMRLLARRHGASYTLCEVMLDQFVVAIKENRKKNKHFMHISDDEHPVAGQLMGAEPEQFAAGAKRLAAAGFDVIDINFGCPVKKVVTCNGGSGLLRDLPLVNEILTAVRAAIDIPLTCKFRAGWNDRELVYRQMGQIAEDNGLAAVAMHARTREQGYAGVAHWPWIAELKAATKLPVIGNGDIRTPEDAVRMVEETGCDAVMIGRTAASNPWIFRQIGEYLTTGAYSQPTEQMRYEIMRHYFQMLVDQESLDIVGKMKQFATHFTHGVRNGTKLRVSIYGEKTPEAIIGRVDEFFSQELVAA